MIGLSNFQTACLIISINGYAGLIMVDNMHFQYNTLLYGIMIFAITFVLEENFIVGAVIYCVLLNMKHIFIYLVKFLYIRLGSCFFYLLSEILCDKREKIKN